MRNFNIKTPVADTGKTTAEMRNALKAQISERLMGSIECRGELIFAINLTTGVYVANVVASKVRNQLEIVGLSTPNCDANEKKMLKDVLVEMLSNGEIADMIRSVAPKRVYILPYEGFDHSYLYDMLFLSALEYNPNQHLDNGE